MICFSGVRIEPSSKYPQFNGTPTLTDIALGLGRMPRFAGHTRVWWSGLHHILVCHDIAKALKMSPRLRLLLLLHDAHESVTGDVPAFYKSAEMRGWQQEIDERLFKSFGLWPLSESEQATIHEIDGLALRAEASILGPPNIMSHLDDPREADRYAVRGVLARYCRRDDTDGLDSPAAREFYRLFAELIGASVHDRRDDAPHSGRTGRDEESPYRDG